MVFHRNCSESFVVIAILLQTEGVQGSGFGRKRWKNVNGWKIGSLIGSSVVRTYPNPIAAGPYRLYRRIAKTGASPTGFPEP